VQAKFTFLLLWTAELLSQSPATTLAKDYFDEGRTITGTPQSTTERFNFTLRKDNLYPYFELTIEMSQGRADLRILDPAGHTLEELGAENCSLKLQPIHNAITPGSYTVELTTSGAVGHWHLRILGGAIPGSIRVGPGLASGIAMIVVVAGCVWYWRRWSDVSWKWFWIGAALWAVAVAVKFAIAIPLNEPLFKELKSSLPHWAYLAVGTIYGGGLTGVTEVLFTFIAALIWPRMAATAQRAVAIGLGAGVFEAAMLALAIVAGAFFGGVRVANWSLILVPAVERLIAIQCHIAARVLVLLAVARRQWVLFWGGFGLLSAVDALATYLYLTDQVNTLSPWTIELMMAPFGLLSIPITLCCVRQWPPDQQSPASPTTAEEIGVTLGG
jgi:uncharacterized membrane protein YhfC